MQLYVIDWSYENSEDQIFATNAFCEYLKEGKIYEKFEGFEMIFCAHTPQNGSGTIICKAQSASILFQIFNIWRENFSIKFNFKPAMTSEELLEARKMNAFWTRGL